MKDPLANPLTRSRLLRLGAGGAAALGLAPLVAACGDDDSGGTSSAASSAAPEATSAPASSAAATTEAATSAAETTAAETTAAATSAAAPSSTASTVGGTADMWWWGETEAVGIQQWVDDTIAMFKEQLGGEIDPTLVDTDAVIPGFTEAAAAGQPADVQFLFNGIYHMENVWLGYLDPLDGLISAETVAEGGGTAMSVYEGKTYRTGFYAIGFGVMYNKELFTQAGLDPEAPPQTWDEFLAACEALKAKDIVPMGAGVSDGYFGEWYFVNSLTQNLDSPADALNLFIGELDWNDPKYHEHWVKLREMKDKGYFNDDVSSLALYQGLNLFDTGKAAMAINTTPALPNTLSKLGAEKVGYIVLPTFGTGAMAGKPITDTQGFGHPVEGGREGDRRRLHRLHALAGAPAGDVDDVEADPGRLAVRCLRHRRPVHQDRLRHVGRGLAERLHRRPDARRLLDRRHVRLRPEDPGRRDDGRRGGRPVRRGHPEVEGPEPRHGRELHDLGHGPGERVAAVRRSR